MPQPEMTLRFFATPTDIGLRGEVPGGRVLEWIDKAAYGAAVAYSGKYCVTAYVGNIHFTRSITSGELVEAHAKVVKTGRSSMTILVSVRASSLKAMDFTETTRCALVFVALDENGKSTPVPPFEPQDEVEKLYEQDAIALDGSRKIIGELMSRAAYTDAGQGERITMRFLAAPADVNWGGKVHGGTVMRWIDDAAYACALRWTGGDATAVYAGGVRFYRPMLIGHLVEVEARLLHTSGSTMHISVHVHTGDPKTRIMELTTHCLMVVNGLDAQGRPTDVTKWVPTIGEDITLDRHAQDLQAERIRTHYLELFTQR